MLLSANLTNVYRTSWPTLSKERTPSPTGSDCTAVSTMEGDTRKPTKPSRPYRNSPSAPKKYFLVDQSEHPRSAPIRKKSFNKEKSEEASNVIFNPVFSHSEEFEKLDSLNMLTDSPTPTRKGSFEAGDLSRRGSRENSPRRWHSMPQDTKKPSPVPNVAKHRLKSPALSSSQCSNSDGRYSEEGSVISSDDESVDAATAMVTPKVSTIKRQPVIAKTRSHTHRRAMTDSPSYKDQRRKFSYDESRPSPGVRYKSKRSNSVCSYHPNGECPLGAGSGLEVLDLLCNRLDNILRDEAKHRTETDSTICRLDQTQMIDDLQAQNRALEEKNKSLEEKCQRLTNTSKELHHHLTKLVKAYQSLEKKLNDESAEKEAYINRLVSIYQSGKDISGEDELSLKTPKTPKTPSTPLQPNGKCHSPSSSKHFNTLPHPPKSKQLSKETSV